MGITERFARFIVETGYDAIPGQAILRAKQAAFDCLGVTLGGVTEPVGKVMTEYVRSKRAAPEAGVVGGGFRTSAEMAALANGTLSHALDYDDVGLSMGHPSVPIVPTVLTLGEKVKATGREVLEALVIGYEIEGKLAFGCDYSQELRGFHPTALFGTMGATASSAKLLKLDVDKTNMAFGIAASQVAGLLANSGTMTKPLHAGNACRAGVQSALLASEGFTGAPNIIELAMGYGDTFIGRPKWNEQKMGEKLGNPFHLLSHGMAVKKYPCCMLNHRALDAIFGIIEKEKVTAKDVKSVIVGVPRQIFPLRPDAHTGLEGKFCLPYVMAAALYDGKVGLDTFTDEMVLREPVQELMTRVTLQVKDDVPIYQGSNRPYAEGNPVSVRLKNGRVLANKVDNPRGSPSVPLTDKERYDKYYDCAKRQLSPRQIKRSSEMALNLEQLKDIGELMKIVTRKSVLAE